MLKLAGLHKPAPCLLLGIKPLIAGYALRPFDSALGERQNFVVAALRSLGGMLPDVTGLDHLIHGPPRRVGVSVKVSVYHVAVGDVAVHSHVRYRSIRAVLEGLPLRPAGIVFAPVAVALAVLAVFRVVAPGASFGPGPWIAGKVSRIKHGGSLTARPYVMLLGLSGLFLRRLLWRVADLRPRAWEYSWVNSARVFSLLGFATSRSMARSIR